MNHFPAVCIINIYSHSFLSTLQMFPFKVFMAYLLVIVAGSRGSRFYRNTVEQTDVVDNHPTDRGEAKTMQDIGKHPAKLYQEEAEISYDLPSDLAFRRQTCIKRPYFNGDKRLFECKSDCCCRGRQRKVVSCVKYLCEECLNSQCQSG